MGKINNDEELSFNLRLIAGSSFIVFIGVILSKLLSYLYTIIIARYFGPEIYGLFSLAVIIVSWFLAFAGLGLFDGIARYIPIYRGKNQGDKTNYIIKYSFKILLFSGIFFGVILFLLSDIISNEIFHNKELIPFLRIFSLLIPISIISSLFLSILRSYEKIKEHSFIFNIFQNAVKLIFIVIFIYLGFKTDAVIYSYFVGIASMALLSYYACKKTIPEIFKKSSIQKNEEKSIKKDLYKYSIPLLLFGTIYSIFYWVDSLSIGYLKGASEVGHYSSAVSISLLLLIVPNLFMQLFFPLIIKEYSKNNTQLIKQISKQVGKWIFMLNIPVFVLLFLFPGSGINILFGKEYLVAETSLRILLFATFFSSIFLVSMQLLSMVGKSKTILADIIIALIMNIVLNFLLIPMPNILFIENSSGINGAAIATTLTLITLYSLFLIQAKHSISIVPLRRKMLSISLAAIISAIVIIYLKQQLVINIYSIIFLSSLFFLLYVILIILFKGFDKEDINIINLIRNKIFEYGKIQRFK